MFDISTLSNQNQHLFINTTPNEAFLNIKNNFNRAKRNSTDFINDVLPTNIVDIKIAFNERIIKIITNSFDIYFIVRGSASNVIFVQNSEFLSSFKKIKNPEIISEMISLDYISDYHALLGSIPENLLQNDLKINFPFVNNAIKKELLETGSNDLLSNNLANIIYQFFNDEILILRNSNGKTIVQPKSFSFDDELNTVISYSDNVNDAIQEYSKNHHRFSNVTQKSKQIEKYFEAELGKLASKINKLKARIEKGSNEIKYNYEASLLLSNIGRIKKGMAEIVLEDLETGENIKIKLDPKLSPQKNIDKRFEKSYDEKISFAKSEELLSNSLKKYELLIQKKDNFEKINDTGLIIKLYDELFKKTNKNIMNTTPYRHFIYRDEFHIYVGKNSKQNDEITFKFAKQNDYWFHARGYAGSHTVLKITNKNENVPKDVIKAAASIAAYYSKAKTAGLVPVSYTFRKFVRKAKGLAQGQVILQKEKSLIVKPEIPKDCIYDDEN